MSSAIIQLLVLAGIAVFLVLRLRNVLGTREGFEKPAVKAPEASRRGRPDLEVIEGGPDRDITDHVEEGSDNAAALGAMKRIEPEFSVSEFLEGARGAYEMILMAFERGEIDGREHATWILDVAIDTHQPCAVEVELHYGGRLWSKPLETILGGHIDDAVPRLQALVGQPV